MQLLQRCADICVQGDTIVAVFADGRLLLKDFQWVTDKKKAC